MYLRLVSVIMPAYNAGKYIAASIQSVIDQTYQNWELIVADDGSRDNTKDIVEKFSGTDSRIKYFFQQNSGQGKARNTALHHAKGQLIAFLDADDLWEKSKLHIQVNQIMNETDADVVFSSGFEIRGTIDNRIRQFNPHNNNYYFGSDGIKDFIKGNRIPILTAVIKKEVLSAVGFFTEKKNLQNVEDYHLWFKLLFTKHKLKSFTQNLAYYRLHEHQSTNNKLRNILKEINLLLAFMNFDKALKPLFEQEIKKKYRAVFMRRWPKNEAKNLLEHYLKHVHAMDKFFLKYILKLLPFRISNTYFRYVHTNLFAGFKYAEE